MNFDDFRRRADRVREVPLETVLALRNAVRDPRDRQKWHTEQGPVSITGQKFTNWHRNTGGGGAIDLVMHLADLDASAAVAWLEQHLACRPCRRWHRGSLTLQAISALLLLLLRRTEQASCDCQTATLRNFVACGVISRSSRNLSSLVLEPLMEAGKLYADNRGNAVFLMVAGKANRPVGAELRGTGTTCVARHGAGHAKGLGLLLGRCERIQAGRTL